MINEVPLAEYLTEQQNGEEHLVESFVFTTLSLTSTQLLATKDGSVDLVLGPS